MHSFAAAQAGGNHGVCGRSWGGDADRPRGCIFGHTYAAGPWGLSAGGRLSDADRPPGLLRTAARRKKRAVFRRHARAVPRTRFRSSGAKFLFRPSARGAYRVVFLRDPGGACPSPPCETCGGSLLSPHLVFLSRYRESAPPPLRKLRSECAERAPGVYGRGRSHDADRPPGFSRSPLASQAVSRLRTEQASRPEERLCGSVARYVCHANNPQASRAKPTRNPLSLDSGLPGLQRLPSIMAGPSHTPCIPANRTMTSGIFDRVSNTASTALRG